MEVLQCAILQQSFCDTHFLIHLAEIFQYYHEKMPNDKMTKQGLCYLIMFAIKESNKEAEPQNVIR